MFNKFILFTVCICSCFSLNFIAADESKIYSAKAKNYNLSICAIFKNEASNLKDWIDYHRNLGVDHFYLYNAGSRDRYMPVLVPYMNEGFVTLINWPSSISQDYMDDHLYALSTQVPAYENAVNFVAREETRWLIFIDIDEHLVCPNGNLAQILIDYDSVPSINLTSDSYDATINELLPLKKLFSQTMGRLDSNTEIVNTSPVKMIFKPELCSGFSWPPYQCKFNTHQSGIKADPQELRINHYLNKGRSTPSRKNKPLGKQADTGNIMLTVAARIDAQENENHDIQETEYLDQPMYLYMPEFLKKLKSKELEKSTF